MSSVSKPIILDETGQQIVEAIQAIPSYSAGSNISIAAGSNPKTISVTSDASTPVSNANATNYIYPNIAVPGVWGQTSTWRPQTPSPNKYIWGQRFSDPTTMGNSDTGDINLYLSSSSSGSTEVNMNIDGKIYADRGFIGGVANSTRGIGGIYYGTEAPGSVVTNPKVGDIYIKY